MDSWDNEWLRVRVAGKQVYNRKFSTGGHGNGKDLECGHREKSWKEAVYTVDVELKHADQTVQVIVDSGINEGSTNESLSIANVELYTWAESRFDGGRAYVSDYEWEGLNEKLNFILGQLEGISAKALTKKGWTIVDEQNFRNGSAGFSVGTYNCQGHYMVGGYGKCGRGCRIRKNYSASAMGKHDKVRVSAYLFAIDSWDNEWARVNMCGRRIYNRRIGNPSSGPSKFVNNHTSCGHGSAGWWDGRYPFDVTFDHTDGDCLFDAWPETNEGSTNESLGIGNYKFWVHKV